MNIHKISNSTLTLDIVEAILENNTKIELSQESVSQIVKCRKYLDEKIKTQEKPIYGINTGFGSLYNKSIPKNELENLQTNLVMSHACGVGEQVPTEIVKIMILFKIQSLSFGNSGVQLETVERLIYFFNNDILPVIYQQGSLGASGDLAPLAHLSLALLGMGEVHYKCTLMSSEKLHEKLKLMPIKLQSKEGLALLNGTQFMSSYAVWSAIKSRHLAKMANTISALSLEAYDGRIEAFNPSIQKVRAHKGQIDTAKFFNEILKGSEIISQEKEHVQDPYSFRCIPQVHGASVDTISYVSSVFEKEINSVTDNPTVFPDEDLIISGGNFHGQPLAITMDFLAIALSELGNISERRIYQLVSGKRNLPSYLVKNAGINSGFMIAQYTAASIVSQNKQFCTPASVDSIESSQGQEDHVSMGANAATKLYKVVRNLEKIIAIELFTAAQAIEFRRPLKTSKKLEKLIVDYRKRINFIENDTIMYTKIEESINFVKDFKFF
jgi:histidine ammonia-lyase